MKTQLIILGLLATLAANSQTPFTAEMKWWLSSNVTLPSGLITIYPEDSFAMPPAPVLTTDWETNMTFNGREYGYRSDGVVVWRLKFNVNTLTATNKSYSYSVTNSNVESLIFTNKYTCYTNITLEDILDNATKPGDLFRASRNGDPIYISLEGVTNLVQLCNKIGHVWKYTNLKNRRCILCDKLVTLWEEWE